MESAMGDMEWKAEEVVAGSHRALQALRELLSWPILFSSEASILGLRWPKGLLMYGPPGTGKTSLVHAIVRECHAHLTLISAGLVHRAFAGESERILREAFAEASSQAATGRPAVIFIDEIDALCPRRDSRREQESRIVAQLLTLMDGTKALPGSSQRVVVVAATNRVNAIDPALHRSGCFDAEIEGSTPNEEQRFQILKLYARKLSLDESVNVHAIAVSCNGYVGADLEAVYCEAAKSSFIGEGDLPTIKMEDWVQA